MRVNFYSGFTKNYIKRISRDAKLMKQINQRIALFSLNPTDPILKDHSLTGAKRNLRAFSVTGDIRIIYLPISKNEVTFMDIGSHNQVY